MWGGVSCWLSRQYFAIYGEMHLSLEQHVEWGMLCGGLAGCPITHQNSVNFQVPVIMTIIDDFGQAPGQGLVEPFS